MRASQSEHLSLLSLLCLIVRFQLEVEGVVENELGQRPVRPHTLAMDLWLLDEVVLTLVDEGTI
jgi:hypothetical protein